MPEVFASLGSNLNRSHNIRAGVQALRTCYGELRLSPVYQNRAVGFDGDDFFNMVVAFETSATPQAVQQQFRKIEDDQGRIRNNEKYSPRELDIDLILYGDLVNDNEELKLPREDITKYAFVLLPLAELQPAGIHPESGLSYGKMWEDFSGSRELKIIDLSFN